MIYKIFSGGTPPDLEAVVTFRLSQGWKLAGGIGIIVPASVASGVTNNCVQVIGFEHQLMFYQAMTYEGDDEWQMKL